MGKLKVNILTVMHSMEFGRDCVASGSYWVPTTVTAVTF
jgi:hypothetical protein